MLRAMFLILAVAAVGAFADAARADGLPVIGVDVGWKGVAAGEADARYVTVSTPGGTVVARVQQDGGWVLRSTFLPRRLTIPAVAFDGSASGLSADGETLVLIRPRATFPQARTQLSLLDADRLRVRRLVTLRGDFSFDAVSPNGRWLYLIEYTSPRDPTRYAVRAYDTRAGRLVRNPIIDPREPDEAMRGLPLTRAVSADGRWAYTLYDGKEPFIHALDTSARTARCIDLDALAGRSGGLAGLRLDVRGDKIDVVEGLRPVAVVDTRDWTVAEPPPRPDRSASSGGEAEDGGIAWALLGTAGAGVLVAAAALSYAFRRRRAPAPA